MKYEIGFGRAAKLLNLVFKAIPKLEILDNGTRLRIKKFLHVPLDSFSIRGLINIIDYKIPRNASMGFIKDKKSYFYFQEQIRILTDKAKVSPIDYEILCWDVAHQ
ncbi:MAG: hypothetical protein O9264_12995 [Leptospira sp.]|nr:hypothetical protein [Leptospira sp.]